MIKELTKKEGREVPGTSSWGTDTNTWITDMIGLVKLPAIQALCDANGVPKNNDGKEARLRALLLRLEGVA